MPGKMVTSKILNGRFDYFPDLPACDPFIHNLLQAETGADLILPGYCFFTSGLNQRRGPSSPGSPVRSSRLLPLRVEVLSDASFLSRRFLRW